MTAGALEGAEARRFDGRPPRGRAFRTPRSAAEMDFVQKADQRLERVAAPDAERLGYPRAPAVEPRLDPVDGIGKRLGRHGRGERRGDDQDGQAEDGAAEKPGVS